MDLSLGNCCNSAFLQHMPSENYCTNCGTGNEKQSEFCKNCGQKLVDKYNAFVEQPVQSPPVYSQPSYQNQPVYGQQPMGGAIQNRSMMEYMMLKKNTGGPAFVSICCVPGAGLLMVDSNKYFGKFLISFVLSFFFIGYIMGIVWTFQAVDEHNKKFGHRLGMQAY